jgi:hypothetical protein
VDHILRVVVAQLTQQAQHRPQDRVLVAVVAQPLQAVMQLLAALVVSLLVVAVVVELQPMLLVTRALAALAALVTWLSTLGKE